MSDLFFLWELAPELIRVVNLFFKAFVVARFLWHYLKHRITVIAAGGTYALVYIALLLMPPEIPSTAAGLICAAATLAAMLFFERDKPRQKIFLSVTAYVVPWMIHSAVVIPWDALYDAVLMNEYVLCRPWLNFVLFVVFDVLYYALNLLLLDLVFRVFNRFYIYKNEELSTRELVLMLLPVLPVIGGFWLVAYFENVYEKDNLNYIWNTHEEYQWIMLLYQAVLFCALLVTVYTSQKIKKSRREEKETAVLLEQTEDIRRHINHLEKLYADLTNLRHDVRNHIFTLESLYKNGEHEQAAEYAQRLTENIDSLSSSIKSGNPVTDVILEEKRSAAEQNGVDFECGFFFPQDSDVNAFDISVILNNALDNALESTAKNTDSGHGSISVTSRRRKNSFLIEVRNTFSGKITLGDDGLPETTKPDKHDHGCGLSNIRRVAGKYNGELAFEVKDNFAELTVMLSPEWSS